MKPIIFVMMLSIVLCQTSASIAIAQPAMSEDDWAQFEDFLDPFQPKFPKKEIPVEPAVEILPAAPVIETPIAPPAQQAPIVLPALTITGLVWNTDRPQAIVNNTIVDIGDTIGEVVIEKIRREGIDVRYREKNFFITQNTKETQSLASTAPVADMQNFQAVQ